jgi:hypothetical protein
MRDSLSRSNSCGTLGTFVGMEFNLIRTGQYQFSWEMGTGPSMLPCIEIAVAVEICRCPGVKSGFPTKLDNVKTSHETGLFTVKKSTFDVPPPPPLGD